MPMGEAGGVLRGVCSAGDKQPPQNWNDKGNPTV